MKIIIIIAILLILIIGVIYIVKNFVGLDNTTTKLPPLYNKIDNDSALIIKEVKSNNTINNKDINHHKANSNKAVNKSNLKWWGLGVLIVGASTVAFNKYIKKNTNQDDTVVNNEKSA